MRESPQVARSAGIPILRLKVTVFTIAGALAGVQGVLQVFFLRYIDPSTFGVTESLNLIIMNVLGGMHTIVGPILGAIFLVIVPELLRGYVALQQILFGIALIIVMALFPGGLAPVLFSPDGWLRQKLVAMRGTQ